MYAYLLGYFRKKACRHIRIGGMPDHIHVFAAIRPDIAVSEFVQVMKTKSSKWLKQQQEHFPDFSGWGNGYAAFTYAERDKELIVRYISKQKEHHKTIDFRTEYGAMLLKWGINPEEESKNENISRVVLQKLLHLQKF